MSKLVYSLMTSLDGYAEDARGGFGWGAPQDEEVNAKPSRAFQASFARTIPRFGGATSPAPATS